MAKIVRDNEPYLAEIERIRDFILAHGAYIPQESFERLELAFKGCVAFGCAKKCSDFPCFWRESTLGATEIVLQPLLPKHLVELVSTLAADES